MDAAELASRKKTNAAPESGVKSSAHRLTPFNHDQAWFPMSAGLGTCAFLEALLRET